MKTFEQQKHHQLSQKDKSAKQSWDEKIISLCRKINAFSEYYTTSSCSGRIVLIKGDMKKQPNLFLKVWHKPITVQKLKKELQKAAKSWPGLVYFKQEPVILHVAAKDLAAAQNLIEFAIHSGWKRCGIIAAKQRFVVELANTERLEFPVINKEKILVNDSFLRLIIQESSQKLRKSWEKIKRLEKELREK